MQDLDKIIWRDALTFVDFFATWCGPCRMMHPVVDRFKQEMQGRIDVYKVDVDDRSTSDFVARYRIASVPTLIFFRRGEILWRPSESTTQRIGRRCSVLPIRWATLLPP